MKIGPMTFLFLGIGFVIKTVIKIHAHDVPLSHGFSFNASLMLLIGPLNATCRFFFGLDIYTVSAPIFVKILVAGIVSLPIYLIASSIVKQNDAIFSQIVPSMSGRYSRFFFILLLGVTSVGNFLLSIINPVTCLLAFAVEVLSTSLLFLHKISKRSNSNDSD